MLATLAVKDREMDVRLREADDEEGALANDIERVESDITELRLQIESKQIELSRVEGRIETMRLQFDNLQEDSEYCQETVAILKASLSKYLLMTLGKCWSFNISTQTKDKISSHDYTADSVQ